MAGWKSAGIAVGLICGIAGSLSAQAQDGKLSIELNKLEPFEGGCRSFFLFRNRTPLIWSSFEVSLAILDRGGVIDRLLTIEAAPLPAARTTLKLFEIPEISCDGIGSIIFHDIASCAAAGEEETGDCFAMVELNSLTAAPLVN